MDIDNINRQVVITGMGVVSPFGVGCETFWQAISGNQCAIAPVERFAVPAGIPNLGATIPAACLAEIEQEYGGQICRWAMQKVLEETCRVAQVAPTQLRTWGEGAVFFSNHFDADAYEATMREGGQLSPAAALDWCLDRWAVWLQNQTAASHSLGIITACTGSNVALGLGFDWISSGLGKWALVGGMDMLHPELLIELDCVRMLSATGCRPFAADRDGTVLGDGAGLLLLEDAEHARQRNAPILATMAGYSLAADTTGLTKIAADGSHLAQAIRDALRQAETPAEEVGYINTSATGSPALDDAVLCALHTAFAGNPPPISSLKSQVGHSIGGSAALESIATILALQHQILPPTLGPGSTKIDTVPYARPHAFSVAMNNAVAMSGHICTTVLKRGEQ